MEYNKLKNELNEAARVYYSSSTPLMSDTEYDKKLRQLKEMEKDITPAKDSPTQLTGSIKEGKILTHLKRMYSISDAFSLEEFYIFTERSKCTKFSIEKKLDGMAVELVYDASKLIAMVTSGDHIQGNIINNHIPMLSNIPEYIDDENRVAFYGEVTINTENFLYVNLLRRKVFKAEFKNKRNAVSGLLNANDFIDDYLDILDFTLWDTSIEYDTVNDLKSIAINYGFETLPNKIFKRSELTMVDDVYNVLDKTRHTLDTQIDGLVIRCFNTKEYEAEGVVGKYPKGALALKFSATEVYTELEGVEFTIAQDGTLVPTGILTPIEIDGTTVQRVLLYNMGFVKRENIKIGSKLKIIKSGDIIPKVIEVINPSNVEEIIVPTLCPECNSILDGFKCINDNCSGKLISRITSGFSRELLNAKGVSYATIKRLVTEDIVNSIVDVFNVERATWISLFGDIQGIKLYNAIHRVEKPYDYILLASCKFPGVGRSFSKKLLKDGLDLDNVLEYKPTFKGRTIERFIADINKTTIIKDLIAIVGYNKSILEDLPTFSITGIFKENDKKLSREDIKKRFPEYSFTSTISKDLKFLLVGDKPSSKLEKAKKLNIPLVYKV